MFFRKMTELQFKLLSEIIPQHYPTLVDLLQAEWKHLPDLKPEDLANRARQGQFSIVAYLPGQLLPIGLIQTIALESLDVLNEKNYHQLIDYQPISLPKIRVCMDITIDRKLRELNLGRKLVDYTLHQIAANQPWISRVLTYTPEGVENWHIQKNGAKPTGIIIPKARPGHTVETVVMTEYTHKLNEYRQN